MRLCKVWTIVPVPVVLFTSIIALYSAIMLFFYAFRCEIPKRAFYIDNKNWEGDCNFVNHDEILCGDLDITNQGTGFLLEWRYIPETNES